jgi:hypothetical protein
MVSNGSGVHAGTRVPRSAAYCGSGRALVNIDSAFLADRWWVGLHTEKAGDSCNRTRYVIVICGGLKGRYEM